MVTMASKPRRGMPTPGSRSLRCTAITIAILYVAQGLSPVESLSSTHLSQSARRFTNHAVRTIDPPNALKQTHRAAHEHVLRRRRTVLNASGGTGISGWAPEDLSKWANDVQLGLQRQQEQPSSSRLLSPPSFTNDNAPSSIDSVSQTLDQTLEAFDKAKETNEALVTAIIQSASQWYQHLPVAAHALLIAIPILSVVGATLIKLSYPPEDFREDKEPYIRGYYDPTKAKKYYDKRPMLVAQRSLQLLRYSNRFLFQLFLDKFRKDKDEVIKERRAQDLLELITKLGPTAIKVGQALSVRSDLIPAEYAKALSSLQDQVPPFPTHKAIAILKSEWGAARYRAFISNDRLSESIQPVASASIGQVYKVKLSRQPMQQQQQQQQQRRSNTNTPDGNSSNNNNAPPDDFVAIKVQRPNILADIALDLYIVRELAVPFYQRFLTKSKTDFKSLANEWGRGFIDELDYQSEAVSTMRFNDDMKARGLDASVFSPQVIPELSTQRILVTEWVEGQRIDRSEPAEDIPRLCGVALNAYLVMLLELQRLHCDPHPGNLLRAQDGRLCILDFGMTLQVDPDIQYSLLEYIAHCTGDKYDLVPQDLVNMGFLKPEKLEFAKRSGALEPLLYFLQQAGLGGGAKGTRERIVSDFRERYPGLDDNALRKAIRKEMKSQQQQAAAAESLATGITMEVEELQRRNRDAFTIPEWFVYTSRALATLEGVSLQIDKDYSLISSCFPYIAKRLLQDDSPRSRQALRDLLYEAGDRVDPERLGDLVDGLSSYSQTSKSLPPSKLVLSSSSPSTDHDSNMAEVGAKGEGSTVDDKIEAERRIAKRVTETEGIIGFAKETADILLTPNGTLIQNILLEESALATTATIKDQLKSSLVDGPKQFRDSLPFGIGSILPPLPTESVSPFVSKSDAESRAQELFAKLSSMTQQQQQSSDSTHTAGTHDGGTRTQDMKDKDQQQRLNQVQAALADLEPEQLAIVSRELRIALPQYTPLISALGNKFVSQLLQNVNEDINGKLSNVTESNSNFVLEQTMRAIASASAEGASKMKDQNEAAPTKK